jgi:MFS family permease
VQKTVYVQLSGLMFFQLVVNGAYSPLIGTYLKDTLHFPGSEVGLVLTVFQVCSMVAPLVAAFLVDRVVPSRTLFAALHLVGAVIAFGLAQVREFLPFLGLFGVYAFFLGPTGGLLNAVTFARMPDGRKHYGAVRLWGTVGWIVAAWALAALWLIPGSSMSWMFLLCSGASVVTALFCLTLPKVPVARPEGKFRLIPREAFRVFFQPSILKFGLIYLFSGILDRFYYIGTAPYLKQLGFSASQVNLAMPLGQITEVVLLLFTGPVLKRIGLRATLAIGLGFQLLRFALMAANPGPLWLLGALSLNGFVFAFFYAVSTIFVDGHTDPTTRGGVHQLMGLVFGGLSSVIGSLVTGYAFDWFASGGRVDYPTFWTIPVVLAAVALALVFILLRREPKSRQT